MEENVIQINSAIIINLDVSVKTSCMWKKTIFGFLLYVVVKMENIHQVLWMIQGLFVIKF